METLLLCLVDALLFLTVIVIGYVCFIEGKKSVKIVEKDDYEKELDICIKHRKLELLEAQIRTLNAFEPMVENFK